MKRALMITTTLAVLGSSVPGTQAGDKEWATAGKVVAGVGAGLLLAKAVEPRPVYQAPVVYENPAAVVVQQPTVVYQPVPVVVRQPAAVVVPQPPQQVVVQQPPIVVYTQPVVVQQPVVVYQATPVVYQPNPVVYAAPACPPPPVFRARPVVGFHFSIGHHHHHRRHGHW